MILSLVFMLIGAWVPTWIPVLLYLVLLCLAALGLIATDNARDAVRLVEQKQAENTYAMRMLRRTADVMQSNFPELSRFAEELKYADPVSTQSTLQFEEQMQNVLNSFSAIPDAQTRESAANQLLDLLKQRNAICLSSKTR